MCGTQSISLRGTRGLATTSFTRALRAVSRLVYRLFLARAVGGVIRQRGRGLAASALSLYLIHPSAWNRNSQKFAPRNSHLAHKDSPFGLCALARPDSTIQLIVKPAALGRGSLTERPGFSVASSGGSGPF